MTTEELDALVCASRAKNEDRGITGILLHSGNTFIQTLEGPDDSVDALFTLIDADPRHHSVLIVRREQIASRRFIAWFMGSAEMSAEQEKSIPGFDDYARTSEIQGSASRFHATATIHRIFLERAWTTPSRAAVPRPRSSCVINAAST